MGNGEWEYHCFGSSAGLGVNAPLNLINLMAHKGVLHDAMNGLNVAGLVCVPVHC